MSERARLTIFYDFEPLDSQEMLMLTLTQAMR